MHEEQNNFIMEACLFTMQYKLYTHHPYKLNVEIKFKRESKSLVRIKINFKDLLFLLLLQYLIYIIIIIFKSVYMFVFFAKL